MMSSHHDARLICRFVTKTCLQGRKVTQPHGDGGGKLWVLFACRKNVAMVFLKGSGVTPMAMAVDACAKVATKVRG